MSLDHGAQPSTRSGAGRPPAWVTWAARAATLLVALTFIALLGGTHPSDDDRDRTLLVVAALVILFHVPVALWIARHIRGRECRDAAMVALLAGIARLIFAGVVLVFVSSISHEEPAPAPAPSARPLRLE